VGLGLGFIFYRFLWVRLLGWGRFTGLGFISVFLVNLLLLNDGLDLLVMALSSADNLRVRDLGANLFLHLLRLQAGEIDADLLCEGRAHGGGQVQANLLVLGGGDGDDPVLADGPWSLSTNFTMGLCNLWLGHQGADLLLPGVAGLDRLLPALASGDLLHSLHDDICTVLDRNLLALSRGVADTVGNFLASFLGRIGTGGVREVR